MPVLPNIQTSQSVFSQGALAPQQIQATPDAFGAQVGQAGQQLGGAIQQAGQNVIDVQQSWQAIKNETDVNYAYSKQFTPAFRDLYDQYYTLHGKDAVDQKPVFEQKMMDLQQQFRDQMTNPAQQRMFDSISRKRVEMELDGMTRYAGNENKVYQQQASDGMVQSFQLMAADKWNDPIIFNGAAQSVAEERVAHAQTMGQPIEYAKAQFAKDISNMWSARLQRMADNDPVAAYDMFKNGEDWNNVNGAHHTDVQSQLEPAVRASLEQHLMNQAKQVFARNLAHGMIYGSGIVNPTQIQPGAQDAPPLQAVVEKMESNGKETDANGNLLTSPKGAQGSMQVMPATAANPGYGVTPAKDNSPAELARVGRDYLGAMTARYQDPALTLAAYNAGPGQVDKWIAQYGDPRTGQISSAEWAAKIPFAETRAYVGKGLGMIQQPNDKPTALPTTAELKTLLPQKVEDAKAAAQRMFPNDPAFADSVAARTANQGNIILQGVTAQENAARDTLTRLLIGSKPDGSDRVTSVDQLLSTPQGKQAWAQATPEVQMNLQNALAKPQNTPMTPEGFNMYYQLRGQAANDPNKFSQQDLSQLYGKMPLAQILELTNVQAGLAKHDTNAENKSLNWMRTKGDVDDMLKNIGKGLGSAAKPDTDEMHLTEQFYGKLQEQLVAYHDQNKKYPDTPTTRQIAASLLAQGTQPVPGILWGTNNKNMRAFQSPDTSKFTATVPDDQKAVLQQTFQRVYGHVPTDAELNQAYTQFTMSKQVKK